MVRPAGEVRVGLPPRLLCVSGVVVSEVGPQYLLPSHTTARAAGVYLNAPVVSRAVSVFVQCLDANGLQLCPKECFQAPL